MYRMLNISSFIMAIPMQRVALTLTYMEGPKVEKWAYQQAELMGKQVFEQGRLATDEGLWSDFVANFRRQFRDTAEEKRAWAALQILRSEERRVGEEWRSRWST